MNRLRSGIKAIGPYAFATTTAALTLLQTASNMSGCAPCVGIVAGVAIEAIMLAQTAEQNREDCLELAERISQIMVVLVTPYVHRQTREVQADLQGRIRRLQGDIEAIASYLRNLQSKSGLKAVFMSPRYARRLLEYYRRLEWAIKVFQVESQIEGALHQYEMGNKISEIHSAVRRLTLQSYPASKPLSLPMSIVPPKPEIFYGRDEIVEDIVERTIAMDNTRLAILGPGGLGKTSVALAVLQDTRMVTKFADHRYWIPCMQATSPTLLVGLLARSLKLSNSVSGHFEQVLSVLKADNDPKIILLDNFETPWDLDGERMEIEDILCSLTAIQQVSILITMRSDQPPSMRIQWTQPLLMQLTVLGADVARKLYLHIDPSASNDLALDELLEKLSYMPLAVTLMANRGLRGESPTSLLVRWNAVGTKMLHQGRDRSSSVQISIQLSIESNAMKNNPDAIVLLSMLSKLPSGAMLDFLPEVAPSIDTAEASFTLLQASLAYLSPDKQSIHVLSPIQYYVQLHHPPTSTQWDDLFNAYRRLLLQGGPSRIHRRSSFACQSISKDVVNLEALIKEALNRPDPELAIESALTLGWHQYYTVPNVKFMQMTLDTAKKLERPDLVASCQHCLGDMQRIEGGIEAKETLLEALKMLEDVGNKQGQGECLWSLGCILVNEHRFSEARTRLNRAMELFKDTGDDITLFECLEVLSDIDSALGRPNEARAKLEAAYEKFRDLKPSRDVLGLTESLLALGDVMREEGRVAEAKGKLDVAKRLYADAKAKLDDAGVVLMELANGSLYYEGWRSNSLGQLYAIQGRYEEAKAALEDGQEKYRLSSTTWGTAECLLSLGQILKKQRLFEQAEAKVQTALEKFQEIHNDGGSIQCLLTLKDIYVEVGRLDQAIDQQEEADKLLETATSEGRLDGIQHFKRISKR